MGIWCFNHKVVQDTVVAASHSWVFDSSQQPMLVKRLGNMDGDRLATTSVTYSDMFVLSYYLPYVRTHPIVQSLAQSLIKTPWTARVGSPTKSSFLVICPYIFDRQIEVGVVRKDNNIWMNSFCLKKEVIPP